VKLGSVQHILNIHLFLIRTIMISTLNIPHSRRASP